MRVLLILIPESAVAECSADPAVRLERATEAYYAFQDAGVEVVLASPDGGAPRLATASVKQESAGIAERFKHDARAIDEFSDTLGLDQIYTGDFDAAFCVGLPGSIWQPEPKNPAAALIAKLLDAGKPVAVMPSGVDLAPKGTAEGLLILGDGSKSPILAAQALISAVRQLQIISERNVP
jgi:putative intracellular protease/amidase